MTPKQQAYKTLANTMIKNFAKRNMEAFYCETKEDAKALAMELMKDGGSVGMGGSETVKEIGLLDEIKCTQELKFIDRSISGDGHIFLLQIYYCIRYTRNTLTNRLNPRFTVGTHHAIDKNNSFHITYLHWF